MKGWLAFVETACNLLTVMPFLVTVSTSSKYYTETVVIP